MNRNVLENLVETRGVQGVFEIGYDGFLVDSLHSTKEDPEKIAAIFAVSTHSFEQFGKSMAFGKLNWILIEFAEQSLVIYPSKTTIYVVIAHKHLILGDILVTLDHS